MCSQNQEYEQRQSNPAFCQPVNYYWNLTLPDCKMLKAYKISGCLVSVFTIELFSGIADKDHRLCQDAQFQFKNRGVSSCRSPTLGLWSVSFEVICGSEQTDKLHKAGQPARHCDWQQPSRLWFSSMDPSKQRMWTTRTDDQSASLLPWIHILGQWR